MIHKTLFNISSGQKCNTAMSINMIRTVLCIILNNYYQTVFPDGTVAQVINKHPDCQIIIGDMCNRGWFSEA